MLHLSLCSLTSQTLCINLSKTSLNKRLHIYQIFNKNTSKLKGNWNEEMMVVEEVNKL